MDALRLYLALLAVGVVAAVGGFSVPVSAEPYGSCGLAGTWVFHLGDPSGPEDHPEFYGEYVACGEAAAVPRAVMLVGLLLIAAGTTGLLMQRSRKTDW